MKGVYWGGAEGACYVSHSGILGCAQFSEETGLARVPDWGCVGENREDDGIVDDAPLRPLEASDRVSQKLQCL